MPIAYSPDALIYDSGSNTWTLRPDFDPDIHRVNITFTDDDAYLDGDVGADEVGHDTNQTAVVTEMDGTPIASGQVYDEEFYSIWDGVNPHIFVERVEIGGVHVGYVVSEPLTAGVSYTQSSINDVGDPPQAPTYDSFTDVPCFGPDTMIATERGDVPVRWLKPGALVLTRDAGYQPVRWVGRFALSAEQLDADRGLHPIHIARGQFAPGIPRRPLLVSPQHRILLRGAELELHFWANEVFCAAQYLFPKVEPTVTNGGFCYFHILFDEHHVILANGLWTESLFAGADLNRIATADR